uniref:Aldehyde oxidase/xanthine dehydrogenase a/b hammerhead domain-containing protein n=1 Tax=Plectus sambesii TaxID=2011161 RepID=A0A914VPR6_9BILA
MHQSGEKHTSGEAVYVDDVRVADCLHLAFVLSTKASAKILSVDTSEALKIDGVECYIDHRDVPGKPLIGQNDTPVFAIEQVTFYGQPIGAVIAKDAETARRAANKVKVTYEDLKPLVTIEQAFEAKSFHKFSPLNIHSSLLDSDTVPVVDWSKFDHVVSGSVKIGGQEHFYLETSGCLVIPGEVNDVEVISSTQSVNDVQGEVSSSLGIPRHKVFVRVKRIGGGFGGKESTAGIMACPTAIAAMKLRRPVRCILERFDDMVMTGTRHAFRVDYKVGLDKEGKLLNFDAQLFNNCGHTLDQSKGVMGRAATHIDSVYKWTNADFIGHLCKTNLQSATAYRGFGAPQAMYATETIMTHIAEATGLDINELREKNLYSEGDRTPFGMTLTECNIRRCWTECKELSKYDKRKIAVDEYNSKHKYKKRGIVLTPTKYGISFSINQLNQAGALVHIYLDGSVLLNHGGMEMGQGLHTKMLQIAARCLEIPIEMVNLHETATDKVPNASPTAASVGSDLNGLAVQDACNKLMARLAPFKKANPTGKWLDWVTKAYVERISLSATGFGIIHSDPVDYVTGKGAELYSYCVYGVACSEVEIDCMTGDHRLLRTDIVMDVGDSLNPALDIGQIEGAFVQGYGMFTMEELKVAPNGFWITRGPGNYKIPSADDAPREFHVKLLKGSSNKKAIFSSRAVGEPPLFLGASAAFAIREAVKAYRMQHGLNGYFRFDSPATPERIRMACVDQFTDKIPELPNDNSFTPWTVQL